MHTNLPIYEFLDSIKLVLHSNCFSFDNDFYKQHFGVAMGSPLSSTVSNLVLEDIEAEIIPSLGNRIVFFRRYIDDCIICIHKDHINPTLQMFNNVHPRIKFTCETEINNTINFLDLTLTRNNQNNKIFTKWYTKDMWTGRYVNYNSYKPFRYKIATINTLIDRAYLLTSPLYKTSTINKVKDALIKNDFPKNITNKYIKKRIKSLKIRKHTIPISDDTENHNNDIQPITYASITFHKNITHKIMNIFQKNSNVRLVPKPYNTLNKIIYTKLKTPIPKEDKSNVIYKINCLKCEKVYIGQTKNYLGNRIKNHRDDIIKKKIHSTALSEHALTTSHIFDFNGVAVLAQEQNWQKRTFLEMAHILKNNTLNFRTDIEHLSYIYHNIIKNHSH